jgi:hypothetical protein
MHVTVRREPGRIRIAQMRSSELLEIGTFRSDFGLGLTLSCPQDAAFGVQFNLGRRIVVLKFFCQLED